MKRLGELLTRIGLLNRRERYSLTYGGWGLIILLMLVVLASILYNLDSFLSPVRPVKSDVLVLEGWVPDYAFPEMIHEFRTGRYRIILVTGGPLVKGFFLSQYQSEARLSAASLIAQGVGKDSVVAVPSPFVIKDRTYESALALRKWIDSVHAPITSFNILTLGAHARRTWMLFNRAFGKRASIGIISIVDLSYDSRHWWTSSEGVRDVIDESVAYLYAKFLFHPPSRN